MSDLKNIVAELRMESNRTIEKIGYFKGEIRGLNNDNNVLKIQVQTQKKQIEDLEEKLKLVKLAKSLSDGEKGSTELKLRINEILREVDSCIALMNN